MPVDIYAPCPCGSGKKFKWCCMPIHGLVNKAFEQDANGQHEAAMRTMEEAIAAHPQHAELWARKAQLLFSNDRVDEAEQALDKAMELNPSFPLGHYLRGRFRHFEGELAGALLLFRKAAQLYDPATHNMLAEVHEAIAECELRLNRPVAARAALAISMKHQPAELGIREEFDRLFGSASRLPATARREFRLQELPAQTSAEQRAAWQKALEGAATGRLSDAAAAFEQLAQANDALAPAWYNLGLVQAWLGENARAVEALDRYVALEPDETKAAEAWALAEVLRCGRGVEEHSDYVEHSATFPMHQPQVAMQFVGRLNEEQRIIGLRVNEEQGILSGIIIEKPTAFTAEHAAGQLPRLASYLMVTGAMIRIWNVSKPAFDRVLDEFRERGQGLGEPYLQTGPAHFGDVLSEALTFLVGAGPEEEVRQRIQENIERHYEETWIHRPLKSLSGVPPIDAVGHGVLRKKVRGILQFIEECAQLFAPGVGLQRVRRKLGLLAEEPAAASAAPRDLSALNTAELAGLNPDELSDVEQEQAVTAALKLDARELAGRFARSMAARPPRTDRPDRYPLFAQLIQACQSAQDYDAALEYVGVGEKDDSEHNEGRRRNDYELRRAQLHARRGEYDLAQDVFDRLIQREPSELRFRGSAAEAMLSARQSPRALRYAEEGLARARQQNDGNSEGHFLELIAAAKKHST
jgi:tetratricopeptide (TPR) repeat protein